MVEEGIFKCPNCLEEKLIWFTNWQMKIINNEEKWIFYRHCENIKEKHICWAIEERMYSNFSNYRRVLG